METISQQGVITPSVINEALNYQEYRQLVDRVLAEGKTTGPNQSEALTNYTKINVQRMKRWDKVTQIREDLQELIAKVDRKMLWIVLTEGWCGDAAQNIPVIMKMAELNPNIEVKFLLRDENLEVMDAYLTNGGRSIPKLIALDAESLEELGTWGPRPAPVQEMVMEHKKNPQESYAEFSEKIHKWYAKDKAQTVQNEFVVALQVWLSL